VSVLAFTVKAAAQIDAIQQSSADPSQKRTAIMLLIAQVAGTAALTVLSVRGELPNLSGKPPLVLENLGPVKVALVGEEMLMQHATTPGAAATGYVRVQLRLAPAQQADYLLANVQGLTREQAEWMLAELRKRGGALVFGGSRVTGTATAASDIDVGFEGMSSAKVNRFMNDFNKQFTGSSKNKIIEHNWIYPGSKPRTIPEIVSPEEFFLRSGVRGQTDGAKAGQPFGPSGYVKVTADGLVEAGRP
jgi:hypothetical protein